MPIKFTFNKRIVVNGREVGAVGEDPARMLRGPEGSGEPIAKSQKITVNGRDYASVEEMPEDLQQVYREALASGRVKLNLGLGRTIALGLAFVGLGAVVLFVALGLLAVALVSGAVGAALLWLFAKKR